MFLVFIINAIIIILNFIIFFLIVGIYNPREFGYLSVAYSIAGFFIFFSDLDFRVIHIKKMAEDIENKNLYFNSYLFIKIILILIGLLIFFLIYWIQLILDIIDINQTQISVIMIILLSSFIASLNLIYSASFQAQLDVGKIQLSNLMNKVVVLLLLITFLFFTKNFLLYPISILLGQCSSITLNFLLKKDLKFAKPQKEIIRKYLKFSYSVLAPQIMLVIWSNLNVLIFLIYFDESLLGVYFILTSLLVFFNLIPTSINMVLIPKLALLVQKNDYFQIKKILEVLEKYLLIISSLIFIGTLVLGQEILTLFIDDYYIDKGMVFLILSAGYTLSWALMMPYSTLNFVLENFKLHTIIHAIHLLLSIISWFFIMPFLNIIGLNLGIWLAFFPSTIILRYHFSKKNKFGRLSQKSIFLLVFLVLTSIIIFFLNSFLIMDFLFKILLFLIFNIFYFVYMIILKILTINDFKMIIEIISPIKIIKDIKDEII